MHSHHSSRRRLAVVAGVALMASTVGAATPIVEYLFTILPGSPGLLLNTGMLGAACNGTLGGNATLLPGSPVGVGEYLFLDGANDFVSVPDAFDYGGAVTVEAWIRPDATNGQRVIWDDYGNPGVLMTVLNGSLQWNISTAQHPGLGLGILVGVVQPGVWQHVAGTYDGAFLRAYINGVLVGCAATTGAIQNNGAAPKIGSDNVVTSAINFAGCLDEFRLFGVALPPSELAGGWFAAHPPPAGDLDGNGFVDGGDLGALLAAWGPCPAPACCVGDLNGDGVIDGSDLGILLASW